MLTFALIVAAYAALSIPAGLALARFVRFADAEARRQAEDSFPGAEDFIAPTEGGAK